MYKDSLPTVCKPVPSGTNQRRLALALALSVIVHGLLLWLFLTRQEIPASAGKAGQSIEVTLTTLPASKPSPATPPPLPQPAPPAAPPPVQPPAPKPPEPRRPKPPVPKPAPKPREKPPAPVPTPTEEPPEPAPPPRKKPPRPPASMAADEPVVPEFKDDFQQLSSDYSQQGRAKQSDEAPAKPDTAVHPGAILNINPKIYYPRDAMRKGMQGVVVVLIHISVDGHTDGVDLIQSSGYEALDNQVLGAVQHWLFTPPRRGNTPVEGTYKHTVIFGPDEEVINDFATHWREIKLQPAE